MAQLAHHEGMSTARRMAHLAHCGCDPASDPEWHSLHTMRAWVRRAALHTLHTVGDDPASDPEWHSLHTMRARVRRAALHTLHTVGGDPASDPEWHSLHTMRARVRRAEWHTLHTVGRNRGSPDRTPQGAIPRHVRGHTGSRGGPGCPIGRPRGLERGGSLRKLLRTRYIRDQRSSRARRRRLMCSRRSSPTRPSPPRKISATFAEISDRSARSSAPFSGIRRMVSPA